MSVHESAERIARRRRPTSTSSRCATTSRSSRSEVHGKPLVYLDNAATTQKPQRGASTRSADYYETQNANIHRGVHQLSASARPTAYEGARGKVAALPQRARRRARSSSPAAPPRASTWSRRRWGRANLKRRRRDRSSRRWSTTRTSCPGRCSARRPARTLRVVPIDDARRARHRRVRAAARRRGRGSSRSATSRTRSARSTRCAEIVELAHAHGVAGAGRRRAGRAAPAGRRAGARLRLLRVLRPQALRADRHRRALRQAALLDAMPPYQGGGDMIRRSRSRRRPTTTLPYKFEAGTPNIAGAVGLGAAHRLSCDASASTRSPRTSTSCSPTRTERLARDRRACASSAPRREKAGVLSFVMDGVHPHDIGTIARPRRHRRPHRPPLRAAGDGRASASRPPRARRSRCTTRATTSTRWSPRCTTSARCSVEPVLS